MIGFTEILIIGGLIILVFGASQIPKIARSIGEGLKEFKKGIKEAKEIDNKEINEPDKIEKNKK